MNHSKITAPERIASVNQSVSSDLYFSIASGGWPAGTAPEGSRTNFFESDTAESAQLFARSIGCDGSTA